MNYGALQTMEKVLLPFYGTRFLMKALRPALTDLRQRHSFARQHQHSCYTWVCRLDSYRLRLQQGERQIMVANA